MEEVREILGCPGVRALLQVIALNAIHYKIRGMIYSEIEIQPGV